MTAPFNERTAMRAFILRVPQALPDVLVFERPIVNATATNERGATWRVRTGVPGMSDLYVVASGGRHVEIETKALRGVLATAQQAWRLRCTELAIPHLVLRVGKGETLEACVNRWVESLRKVLVTQEIELPDDEPQRVSTVGPY
jgi:hypothetical protein